MYTNVIWDIDNTMISSGGAILRALEKLLLEQKGITLTEELHQHIVGLTSANTIEHFEFEDPHAAEVRWNGLIEEDSSGFEIYPGAMDALEELKSRGIALGIVSSRTAREMYGDSIDALLPYFDCIVLAEDVKNPKPDPESLMVYMERTKVQPQNILYVGDAPVDALCCETAGVDFALALWGSIEPQKVTCAKYRIESPQDVVDIVFGG